MVPHRNLQRFYRIFPKTVLFILVALLMMAPVAFAQGVSGRLLGAVEDASGAAVTNATVSVINQDTGAATRYTTDSHGGFTADLLPPGNYRVEVDASGFRKTVSTGNIVTVDNTTRVDMALQLGTATESVVVQGENPLVDTTSSSMGEVLNEKSISSLPLNGRIFSQLVQTTPGAIPSGWGSAPEAASGVGATTAITASVNGMPWEGTTYTLDGVTNMELLNAFMNVTPPLDAIQEVKVSSNNANATVGTYGGAQVNAFIKSGTNTFHGSAYEFYRGDSLNATRWEATTKAPYRGNQFGGSIGGPIIRNKVFFFVDYQGNLLQNGVTYNLTVPTDLMRQGLFLTSQFPTLYDPATGQPFAQVQSSGGTAWQVPTSRFDPVSANIVSGPEIWPEPTNPSAIVNNYNQSETETDNVNTFDIKGDYQFGPSDRLFVRESYQRRDLTAPGPTKFIQIGDVNSAPRDHNAAVGYDHTFSPTALNEFRVGYDRFYTKDFGNDYGTNENTALGIPNGNLAAFPGASGMAIFNIGNIAPTGSQDWTNSHRITNTFQVTDNFTLVRGRHSFTFGEDYRYLLASLTNPDNSQSGSFTFNSDYTSSCTGQPDCSSATGGNQFASFLLGLPSSLYRGFVNTDPATVAHLVGIYGQDDFRLTKNLTVNVALRWDLITNPTDRHNRQSNFDFDTGLLTVANSDNRHPNMDNYLGGYSPRVGFAYSPNNGRTAIRGAFGITHFPGNFGAMGGTLERNFPFFETFKASQQLAYTPWTQVSVEGLPNFVPVSLTPTIVPPENISVYNMPKGFQPNIAYAWHFGIQQQITTTSAFSIAYVGTKGSHLYRGRNIDIPPPGPGELNPRRPYYDVAPGITDMEYRASDGSSIYHALQVELTKSLSHGLQGKVAYTWSKEIDNINIWWPLQDSLNRGVGTSQAPDVPQNAVISLIYQLPFGKGQQWLSNSNTATQWIAGGWQLSTITMLESGTPLSFNAAYDNLNSGVTNRAEVTCPNVKKIGNPTEWFDTSCFTTPAQYQLGNSGYGKVRGPGYNNVDLSLAKTQAIGEKLNLSFQVDAFNSFNNPHFSSPNTNCCSGTNSSFGQISSTNGTPRELQLGVHLTF